MIKKRGIKVGDYLYCYKESVEGFAIGNYYLVRGPVPSNPELICIRGDNYDDFFTIDKDSNNISYADFFKTKQEMREEQLQKILDL